MANRDRYRLKERLAKKAEKLAEERIRYHQLQSRVVRFLVEDFSYVLRRLRSKGYSEAEIVRVINRLIEDIRKEDPSAADFKRVTTQHVKKAFEVLDSRPQAVSSKSTRKKENGTKSAKAAAGFADTAQKKWAWKKEEDYSERMKKLHEQFRPKPWK